MCKVAVLLSRPLYDLPFIPYSTYHRINTTHKIIISKFLLYAEDPIGHYYINMKYVNSLNEKKKGHNRIFLAKQISDHIKTFILPKTPSGYTGKYYAKYLMYHLKKPHPYEKCLKVVPCTEFQLLFMINLKKHKKVLENTKKLKLKIYFILYNDIREQRF